MRRAVLLAAFALAFAAPRDVHAAWGEDGHRLVCAIASLRLTPRAQTFVNDLLRGDSPTLAETCTWADDVRRTLYPQTASYHFVNIPVRMSGFEYTRDCGDPAKHCVVWAIAHYARVLLNSSATRKDRVEALKFLSHFVGDLHQPLHAGRPQDLGGNKIAVNFFGDAGQPDRPNNLHSVWDSGILRRANITWPLSTRALNTQIAALDEQRWQNYDIAGWANESYHVCEAFVYAELPKDYVIANMYYEPALGYTQAQIQKAGVRLAYLLNHIADRTIQLPAGLGS